MGRFTRRALIKGALFRSVATALALALYVTCGLAQPRCGSNEYDAHGQVAYVYDGDTVRLEDGRKVRIVGIDTPELGKDGQPAQPYAEEARQALVTLVADNPSVRLRYARQPRDRYGRLLAHLYLADGRSVAEVQLASGYATALVIPPNVWNQSCYAAVEQEALRARTGIWALPAYQPAPAESLPPSAHGFHIVSGRIERIGESRHSLWLELGPRLVLRVARSDLQYFSGYDPRQLLHHTVVARGWLHYHKQQLSMRIRHPAALSVGK